MQSYAGKTLLEWTDELLELEKEAVENESKRELILARIAEAKDAIHNEIAKSYIGKYFKTIYSDDGVCEITYYHVLTKDDGRFRYEFFIIGDDNSISCPIIEHVNGKNMLIVFNDAKEISKEEFDNAKQNYKEVLQKYMAIIEGM